MATAPPPGEVRIGQSARLMLAEMLEDMHEVLRKIVHDDRTPFPLQNLFIDTWDDVSKAFDFSIRKLRMSPFLFWLLLYPMRLRRVGLTGKMLEMKFRVWKQSLFAWGTPVEPYGTALGDASKVDRALDRINSILGSAAKVFPPLEIAKEYKELLHTQLKQLRAGDDA